MTYELAESVSDSKAPPPGPISYEAYLEWLDSETHAEWVNGEVVLMSPISIGHARTFRFLFNLMSVFVGRQESGELLAEPFQMKTGPDLPGRSPDIFFVANGNLSRLKDTWLHGPADLVVEIISPESVRRNRKEKFAEYQTGGVREYWLIDPIRRASQFFILDAGGQYQAANIGPDGVFRSAVLDGFWIREEWLWQRPQPEITEVMRDWGWF